MAAPVLLAQASAAHTASGSTAALAVPQGVTNLTLNVPVIAASGTSPTLTLVLEGADALGNWYTLWTNATAITAAGDTTVFFGPALTNNTTAPISAGVVVPPVVRLRWTIGGTTPSFTFSASIVGRDMP